MELFGLPPCREVGELLQAVKEAIWNSEIPNNFEEAYKYMLSKAEEMGLTPVNKNKEHSPQSERK